MNKQDVKTICEADDQMCWWAMVLFAEITEIFSYAEGQRMTASDKEALYGLTQTKVAEFQRIIVQGVLQRAKEPREPDQLTQLANWYRRFFQKEPCAHGNDGLVQTVVDEVEARVRFLENQVEITKERR